MLVYAVKDIRVYQKYYTKIDQKHFFKIPLEILLDCDFFRMWMKGEVYIEREIISQMSEENLLFMLQQSEDETRTVLCFGNFSLQFFEKHLLDSIPEDSWDFLLFNCDIDHQIFVKYKSHLISFLTLGYEPFYHYYYKINVPFFIIKDYYPLKISKRINFKVIDSLTNRGLEKYGKSPCYSTRHYYINDKMESFKVLKIDF